MENKVYKTTIKKFLGYDVRIIKVDDYHKYIICKDMFDVLGLVKDDGTWTDAKKKMIKFLDGVDKKESHEKLVVLLKQGKTKVKKEVACLNIETAPLVLTQFEPINSNRRTKEQNKEALDKWYEFMKFVGILLETHSANKYIIKTKNIQKEVTDELYNDGGNPMFMNIHVNKIMGVVLQMEDNKPIKKSEIYQFQNRITEDVGCVRDEVLKTYVTMFKVTEDKEKAYKLTLEWAKKKYLK